MSLIPFTVSFLNFKLSLTLDLSSVCHFPKSVLIFFFLVNSQLKIMEGLLHWSQMMRKALSIPAFHRLSQRPTVALLGL